MVETTHHVPDLCRTAGEEEDDIAATRLGELVRGRADRLADFELCSWSCEGRGDDGGKGEELHVVCE